MVARNHMHLIVQHSDSTPSKTRTPHVSQTAHLICVSSLGDTRSLIFIIHVVFIHISCCTPNSWRTGGVATSRDNFWTVKYTQRLHCYVGVHLHLPIAHRTVGLCLHRTIEHLSVSGENILRYVNQDGLRHYNTSQGHSVCMDCNSYAVFCYSCDDFVYMDTHDKKIEAVRESLRFFNNSRILPSPVGPKAPVGVETEGDKSERKEPVLKRAASDSVVNLSCREESKRVKSLKIEQENPVTTVKLRGLRNLGNTCFMNAVLQALKNIDEFSEYIVKLPELPAPGKLATTTDNRSTVRTRRSGTEEVFLTEELKKTMQALRETGTTTAISPDALFSVVWKLVPRFRGFQQQDAHEFLRCILDRLHTEMRVISSTLKPKDVVNGAGRSGGALDNPVSWIFEGILQSEVTCLICGSSSRKQDPFMDLSLDIPMDKASKNPGSILTLFDCLESFFEKEKLDYNDRYMCNSCRKKQPSTKQFFLRRLPNVLCLHLKRFRYHHHRTKLDGFIQFPVRGLDARPFLLRNVPKTRGLGPVCSEFDLAAVIVHHGSGASSGHYTAYALRESSWFHFNDSTVRECCEDVVSQQKAYMLFFIRKNFNSASLEKDSE